MHVTWVFGEDGHKKSVTSVNFVARRTNFLAIDGTMPTVRLTTPKTLLTEVELFTQIYLNSVRRRQGEKKGHVHTTFCAPLSLVPVPGVWYVFAV